MGQKNPGFNGRGFRIMKPDSDYRAELEGLNPAILFGLPLVMLTIVKMVIRALL